ncbi:MAG: RNA 2',3'-cyclic phosphodiesterase [Gammaproteobacteria bacterium]
MKRLFFALWPDHETRERIAAVSKMLPEKCGRRVPAANLHITLVFLGNIDEQQCRDVQQAASEISSRSFTLKLDRAGKWSRSKVIWLAHTTIPEELTSLVAELNESAINCRIQIENRPYRPHVTLARKVRGPVPPLDIEPFEWAIKSFALVQSETLPQGAQYAVIQNWPLG